VVAFVVSLLILAGLLLPLIPYAKRRPKGTYLSWGEAMAASTYAFFLMFWAYGTVPHLFLTWTSNELNWRPDKLLSEYWDVWPINTLAPQEKGGWLPITISMQTLRDIIVVGIYVVFLGMQIFLWAWWQKRGDKPTAEVATSEYGRPLVKTTRTAETVGS